MGHGGRRDGAGRPRESKDPHAQIKKAARDATRQLVLAVLEPLVQAQIAKAKGIRHLVLRNKKTGMFERVTDPDRLVQVLNGAQHQWEIWTRPADTYAFVDLMNRALDKPNEQQVDVTGYTDAEMDMINRIKEGLAKDKRRTGET